MKLVSFTHLDCLVNLPKRHLPRFFVVIDSRMVVFGLIAIRRLFVLKIRHVRSNKIYDKIHKHFERPSRRLFEAHAQSDNDQQDCRGQPELNAAHI